MGANTAIEWADDTVNFWQGCTQVSPGCDHCYAKALAERFGSVAWNGPPKERVARAVAELQSSQRKAVKIGARRFVFINSMADTFDNAAADEWRRALFAAIHARPDIVALVLTKRIGNVERMMSTTVGWPANAWLGITVVNQQEADRDIPKLVTAKAELRIPRVFLSVEPMLSPVDARHYFNGQICAGCRYIQRQPGPCRKCGYLISRQPIDWVICGGESGAKARPMHPDWARSLRDQCQAAGVPFFFKQWGEHTIVAEVEGDSSDKRDVRHWLRDPTVYRALEGPRDSKVAFVRRVGKARAGRLLDGLEHNGRPQP